MSRIAALIAVAMLTSSFAMAAETPPRTVSTSGEAVVYVAPDEVVLNVGVEIFDPQLDRAKTLNDQASERLLKAIKDMKIEEKHIQTSNMDLEIRYKDHNRPSFGIEGYCTRRSYSVILKDVKLFEKLVDTALKNGANRLMGFEFRTTELRKHRDQARKLAIKAAKEKAIALASELECKVGKPRTINESGGSSLGWNRASFQNNEAFAGPAAEGGETLPLGQIAIRANVSVTFDLE